MDTNVKNEEKRKKILIKELFWGSEDLKEKGFREKYEIILGSDIVYQKDLFEPLLKSIDDLTDHNSLFYLAYRDRGGEEKFFEELEKKFNKVEIPHEQYKDSVKGGINMKKMKIFIFKKKFSFNDQSN